MRVGMLTEMHPELNHRDICQLLIRAELAGGLDIAMAACGARPANPAPQRQASTDGAHGVPLHSAEDLEKARLAGRLAAEVLDMIAAACACRG